MGLSTSNYGPRPVKENSPQLQDRQTLDRLAAVGSFIFVRNGSLYEAARQMGVDVKTG
jgi:hypothetical protein